MVDTRGGARAGDAPPPPPVLDAQQIAAIVAVMQQVQQQQQPPGGNPPPPPGGFSLSPYGRVLQPDTSRRDSELYGQGTRAFESTFDGSLENLQVFVDKIKQRVHHMAIAPTFEVAIDGVTLNLFESYSVISLTALRTVATARWTVADWHKQGSYIVLSHR